MAAHKPRACLLLGSKKSGKTSILNVVLDDIEPSSTVYNDGSRVPWTKRFNAFLDFEFWDIPGGRYDVEHLEGLDLQTVGACIFVTDAQAIQGDNTDQARKMAGAMFKIHEINPSTTFEVFIHKVDGMSDSYRMDVQQDLFNRIRDELNDLADMEFASSSDYIFPVVNYHFTSIYQASILDALSKVISRLMPCQGALERLLDMLVMNSNFDKAYLFDLPTKLYFGTDSTPGDAALHEICTEYTDLHWEMDQIYGEQNEILPEEMETSETNKPRPNGVVDNKVTIRDSASGSVSLSNGFAIAHWELSTGIALVVRLGSNLLAQSGTAVELNIGHIRDAIRQIREIEQGR